MWAIIGGSGFENFSGFQVKKLLDTATPFGAASSGIKSVTINNAYDVIFIPRHGAHHELMPAEINYRANIFALKKLGVTKILSLSAVGSLRNEILPGDMVVPHQYINRTISPRQHTFCGEGITGHVSLAKPISEELSRTLFESRSQLAFTTHFDRTYVCMEGPAFSTRAESHNYRQMGADIVGMTNFPEYALAREAGISYLPCCFVTDFDCWKEDAPHVTLNEVLTVMRDNNAKAFALAQLVLSTMQALLPQGCPEQGLQTGLMCTFDNLPEHKKAWLSVLLNPS